MWNHNNLRPTGLSSLAHVTARLIRIMVYQKIKQGQAQINASGVDIDIDIAGPYKMHAVTELVKSKKKYPTLVEFRYRGVF